MGSALKGLIIGLVRSSFRHCLLYWQRMIGTCVKTWKPNGTKRPVSKLLADTETLCTRRKSYHLFSHCILDGLSCLNALLFSNRLKIFQGVLQFYNFLQPLFKLLSFVLLLWFLCEIKSMKGDMKWTLLKNSNLKILFMVAVCWEFWDLLIENCFILETQRQINYLWYRHVISNM